MAQDRPQFEVAVYDAKVKDRFIEVVGDEKIYNREIIFAMQAIKGNGSLQKCSPDSIRHAVINVALTGATLNPVLQQAHLIPRKGQCCLDFSYRGLANIATASGGVLDIDADVVYENDEFYYERGLNPVIRHIPLLSGNRGALKYAYSTAVLPSGVKKFLVIHADEMEKIKKSSVAYSRGADTPWRGDFEAEMWRKTAVKRLYKLLPQTERMSEAVRVVNEHEGLDTTKGKKAQEIMDRFGFDSDSGEIRMVSCPNVEGKQMPSTECNECKSREGCPEW